MTVALHGRLLALSVESRRGMSLQKSGSPDAGNPFAAHDIAPVTWKARRPYSVLPKALGSLNVTMCWHNVCRAF